MKKVGLFLINFALSLLGYVAMVFLGFILIMMMYFVPFARDVNIVLLILLVHISLIFATLFFLIGSRLNLLGKHWLNYLSVCGTSVITLPLSLQPLSLVANFSPAPFPIFFPFLSIEGNFRDIVILIIVSLLPSLFTWLGMLYKSRKKKKQEANA